VILGDLITGDRSIQKTIYVVGEGGNRKSAFCQLCANFVGEHNGVHLSLQKLQNNRFAPARLYGRLGKICPDPPGAHLVDSAIFKAITGGDRITGEPTYCDPFEFRPLAGLIFSANYFPAARYGTQSFFDRWLLIPCERRFRGSKGDIPRGALDNGAGLAERKSNVVCSGTGGGCGSSGPSDYRNCVASCANEASRTAMRPAPCGECTYAAPTTCSSGRWCRPRRSTSDY
jgi:hypothetical protein